MMDGPREARRRQLANLYQAGNQDALLRRRRPRTSSRPPKYRLSLEREIVRQEKEKALHGSVAETLQYGQRRAWHYGYRNEPGLSGSAPLAAACRYGAKGTLRMVLRAASATRGGTLPEEDSSVEGFQVDEWCPMLRCSTSPSLATMTTPKAWPESATYPHGSNPKRMQPSPWYDGETTANDTQASAAGSGMRRVAANHSFTMLLLRRNAELETAHGELPPQKVPPTAASCSTHLLEKKLHAPRAPKRMDQDMGFLRGGITYITAQKDPLTRGLRAALEARLVRETEQDGLKWSLLSQVLKAITGSQHRLPVQAVKGVAMTFGEIVGTSKLATKAQFIDHITGNHVGFPESELTTLFSFFRSETPPCRRGNLPRASPTKKEAYTCNINRPRPIVSPRHNIAGKGDCGGGGGRCEGRADWTVAVACLRLLAKPKEPVLSAILGVFEVFAIARGDRVRHRRRLEKERLEKERQREMEEERELWKRRRRRQQAMEIAEEEGIDGTKSRASLTVVAIGLEKTLHHGSNSSSSSGTVTGSGGGSGGRDDDCNRASLAETAHMFTLACSNAREQHAVTTTYRHRFRLELKVVMQERCKLERFRHHHHHHHRENKNTVPDSGGVGEYPGRSCSGSITSSLSPIGMPQQQQQHPGSTSPPARGSSGTLSSPNLHPSGARTLPAGRGGVTNAPSNNKKIKDDAAAAAAAPESFPLGNDGDKPIKYGRREGEGESEGGGGGAGGVTVDEFSEALVRCPKMLEAFGFQLAARFRYRHRPSWMAPILRKGG